MAEQLNDERLGRKTEDGVRTPPERDLFGRPFTQVGIELPVGHGHFVVYSAMYAPHLVEERLNEVKALVAAHYAPPAPVDPVVEPPADPGESSTSEKKRKGS